MIHSEQILEAALQYLDKDGINHMAYTFFSHHNIIWDPLAVLLHYNLGPSLNQQCAEELSIYTLSIPLFTLF
jgi:hypothetical protein